MSRVVIELWPTKVDDQGKRYAKVLVAEALADHVSHEQGDVIEHPAGRIVIGWGAFFDPEMEAVLYPGSIELEPARDGKGRLVLADRREEG